MITIRIATAAAWLGLLGLGALAGETAPPSPGPAGHAALAKSFVAGRFSLTAPDGTAVDSDDLAGKPYGLFFGFTHCPDICPTTLAELSTALAKLPTNDFKIYFITVDPERDTPEVLTQYMTSFDPRIVALTGPRAAVDEAMASFGAIAQRVDQPGGGYAYGHTAAILLVNGDGLITRRIAVNAGPEKIAEALTAHTAVPATRPARPADPSR